MVGQALVDWGMRQGENVAVLVVDVGTSRIKQNRAGFGRDGQGHEDNSRIEQGLGGQGTAG